MSTTTPWYDSFGPKIPGRDEAIFLKKWVHQEFGGNLRGPEWIFSYDQALELKELYPVEWHEYCHSQLRGEYVKAHHETER
jgi:hypothetical protein